MTDSSSRDRLGSVGRRGLIAILLAATDGRCAVCARTLDLASKGSSLSLQVSHVVPARGSSRQGWTSGNLFAGCLACNTRTGDRDMTPALPLFRVTDGVPVWTDSQARAAGKGTESARIVDADDDLWMALDAVL